MIESPNYTLPELRIWAKKLESYETDKIAAAIKDGKLPVLDYMEHGVPAEIIAAIRAARSPSRKAALRDAAEAVRKKAKDAERFALLHHTKAEALRAEIVTLVNALAKLDHLGKTKAEHAEVAKLTEELAKAERSLGTALRGHEKQTAETVRLAAEADAADKLADETL